MGVLSNDTQYDPPAANFKLFVSHYYSDIILGHFTSLGSYIKPETKIKIWATGSAVCHLHVTKLQYCQIMHEMSRKTAQSRWLFSFTYIAFQIWKYIFCYYYHSTCCPIGVNYTGKPTDPWRCRALLKPE